MRLIVAGAAAWIAYDAVDEEEDDAGEERSQGGKLLFAAAAGTVAFFAVPALLGQKRLGASGGGMRALAQLGAIDDDEEDCGCDG